MINILFTISHLLTLMILFFVFYFLLRQPKKNTPIKVLTALMAVTLLWTILEVVANFQFFNKPVNLFLVRLATTFVLPVVSLVFLSFLSIVFKKFYFWISGVLLFLSIAFFYVIVFTEKIVKDLLPRAGTWEFNYVPGDWFAGFSVLVFLLLFISLFLLLYKFLTSSRDIRRKQLGYLLSGLVLVILFGALPDLILPLLGIKMVYETGILSGVALAVFIYYVINKFGAFGSKTKKYSLKLRFTFVFVFIVLVTNISGSLFFTYFLNDFMFSQLAQRLKIVAEDRGERADYFLDEQKYKIEYFSRTDRLKKRLSPATTTEERMQDPSLLEENLLKDEFFKYFDEIFVLNKRGSVIDSTDPRDMGADRADQDYFLKGKKGTHIQYFYLPSVYKNGFLAISSPLRNSRGELLAVLVGKIDMKKIFEIMKDKSGLGETGEAYLVDQGKRIITPSRFEEGLVSKKKIDTPNVHNCFAQKHAFDELDQSGHYSGVFRDYRGEEVLGTYAHIPGMNWCLLAEMDTKEINSLFEKRFKNYYLLSFLVLLLLASGFGYLFSYSVSRPISKLKEDIEKTKKNNFNYKVRVPGDDEFGRLAKAFNDMIKEVKESRKNIEEKIRKQTSEIEKRMKEAKKMNKLMTGREIKMRELKRENEKLKKKLKNKKD